MIKRLLLLTALSFPALCHAQLEFKFVNAKAGYQGGPKLITYEGGLFEVSIKDGSYSPSGCAGANPAAGVVQADPQSCPLGTNAYFWGLGDSAGLTGHWSLSAEPIDAYLFETNRPDLFQVLSAPPSLMRRPEALPIVDNGVSIGYSYTEVPYRQYRITDYMHRLKFLPTEAERSRHDETIPPGTYIFGYPKKQTDEQIIAGYPPEIQPVPIESPPMPESYPGMSQTDYKTGFRYTNGDEKPDGTFKDGYWFNGMLELDPAFEMRIEWDGLVNGTNMNANVDRMFLWVESSRSTDPLGKPNPANVLYPLPGLSLSYEIPPLRMVYGFEVLPPFFYAWAPGDEVVLYTKFVRNSLNDQSFKDASYRVWGLPIRFVRTFAGFAFTAFPPNTPEALREPNADYDRDGISNFLEYAANTDPTDITSKPPEPNYPVLVPSVDIDGKLGVTIAKRPAVGSSILYNIQYSTDNVSWKTINKTNDPIWEIIETETSLTAKVRVPGNPPIAFLRAQLILVR